MTKKSYIKLQEELDQILDSFERSEHDDVDALLKDYEKGTKLVAELEEYLMKAEITLHKIKNTK